ncbi:uncharacterized protein B0I36DRAFT_361028 [Microdochium trichocladiopsis]|uniref:Cyanovirin-N domain-containing protein n=1 Tax=Microdochium trichocladiopsis TaxID=1682393 RepID=A0A9P8YD12_9PEZI|nr:uncharacterized protein B0I36DRAFT_361028 [Microdochium trichocladiopsis]KAH7035695.1 hypothetical protein B0I36DRAFT_361028 [Microdochium trichocladiopsis]
MYIKASALLATVGYFSVAMAGPVNNNGASPTVVATSPAATAAAGFGIAAIGEDGDMHTFESGFASTCPTVVLDGTGVMGKSTLRGECRTFDGRLRTSRLDLNHCLNNVNGVMNPAKDGNFRPTCYAADATLIVNTNYVSYCIGCRDFNGVEIKNCVPLHDIIGNIDGRLTCYDYSDSSGDPY